MSVPDYLSAVMNSAVTTTLRPYAPRVVGTLPLGLAVSGSDIDIVCHAPDLNAFAAAVWEHYHRADGFVLYRWTSGTRPAIVRFLWDGWPFELFGDTRPVEEQPGWLHFEVERRLLALGGGRLRQAVSAQRAAGMKTEPAFAAVLGIGGDPYRELLALAAASDAELRALLATGDFA
ncbi:DUF4269 domain-containing protein [Bradyrhizobium sp. ISRA443]|uniref:DUF4269 domain-containing protein n=1 Tax=unclassified Bradyrhizobium TaxID=2631580 RepID=UPI002479F6B3|nr:MULTISPECIES: DUF4269 domain-containing protein [unclassified Bradyrhizobium]WGR92519.1 DUF4269 domain-containing protein [Bradyrhizobium sp. ISRA435]WGR96919.1 DUF4269 domain-containing protein [Bradyrhizobium sp. ISRA436]WGS03806.1 DUF4269 domain-containing protein [Bradyrhizobium sp. ISRA437]WGS10690.1 DUF4269 domain-containing protein [Bradyrhizobium sp. ISRA443]